MDATAPPPTAVAQPTTALDEAFEAVRNAAALALACDEYWSDERDQNAGWQLLWAVDADVLTRYSQAVPETAYGQVFSRESQATSRLMGGLLGDFVLRRLPGLASPGARAGDGDGALLLMPAHDTEFDQLRVSLLRQVLDQGLRAQEQAGQAAAEMESALLQGLPAATASAAEHEAFWHQLADRFALRFKDVMEALDGLSGPQRQLARLTSLRRGRLLNLALAWPFNGETGQPSPLPKWTGRVAPDRALYFERLAVWLDRLEQHSGPRKRDDLIRNDAVVLAHLELINQRLAPQRKRLVLITGAPSMHQACASVRVETTQGHHGFDELYLRHPRCFVGDQRFFDPLPRPTKATSQPVARDALTTPNAPSSQLPAPDDVGALAQTRFRFADWLNLFLPHALSQMHWGAGTQPANQPHTGTQIQLDRAALRRIQSADAAAVALRDSLLQLVRDGVRAQGAGDFPGALLEDWCRQVALVAAERGVASDATVANGTVQRVHWMANLLGRMGLGPDSVNRLRQAIDDRIEAAVCELYLSAGELGVLQLIDAGSVVRGVPALRFTPQSPAAQAQTEMLCASLWRNDRQFDLRAAYEVLSEGDAEGYRALLIHAQVYAARGHWSAVGTLARLAQRMAARLPDAQTSGRDGREAAYLLAVTKRRLAQTADDLHAARRVLQQALALVAPADAPDPRFEAEALAIDAAAWQFARFAGLTLSASSAKAAAARQALLAAGTNPLDVLLPLGQRALAALDAGDQPASVASWVRRQTVTNLAVLALIRLADGGPALTSSTRQWLQTQLRRLRELHLAPDSPPDAHECRYLDGMSSFVYLVAVVCLADDAAWQADAWAALQTMHQLGQRPPPFEQARRQLLMDLASQRWLAAAAHRPRPRPGQPQP